MPKTKFLRVARSGKTVDGREITPAQIDQMAAGYDPKKYGARVNLEHFLSFLPDGPFKAYGDILALKAESDPDGSRVLLAQLDATPDLIKLAADRQKVFWSIEMVPNFAGSGEAYLVGLAATDTPASLGTEMLTFALKSDKAPEKARTNLYSEAVEAALEVEEPAPDAGPTLLARVKDMLAGKGRGDDARYAQVEAAVTAVAEEMAALKAAAPAAGAFAAADAVQAVSDQVAALKTGLADLTTRLSRTDATPPRPKVSGADSHQTDC